MKCDISSDLAVFAESDPPAKPVIDAQCGRETHANIMREELATLGYFVPSLKVDLDESIARFGNLGSLAPALGEKAPLLHLGPQSVEEKAKGFR